LFLTGHEQERLEIAAIPSEGAAAIQKMLFILPLQMASVSLQLQVTILRLNMGNPTSIESYNLSLAKDSLKSLSKRIVTHSFSSINLYHHGQPSLLRYDIRHDVSYVLLHQFTPSGFFH
jgi:hypothetical protein